MKFYTFLVTKVELVGSRSATRRSQTEKKYVTPSLVQDIHKILRTAFNQAKRWKYIQQNPFLDADLPEYKEKERPAFSPEEFEKVLNYTDEPEDYERFTLHLALCIQYYCTTRGGEVVALQWNDYSSEERTLHIYKALARIDQEKSSTSQNEDLLYLPRNEPVQSHKACSKSTKNRIHRTLLCIKPFDGRKTQSNESNAGNDDRGCFWWGLSGQSAYCLPTEWSSHDARAAQQEV